MSISLALGLLQFAPKLVSLFGSDSGSKVSALAETVANVARTVTGKDDLSDATEALKADPQLAYQFQIAVMENETVLERLDEQSRQRASDQYQKTGHKQADKIADHVVKYNLPTIVGLVVANAGAVWFLGEKGTLIAIVSNLIGVVIGQLLQERQSVISFFFGSSLGSKQKGVQLKGKE